MMKGILITTDVDVKIREYDEPLYKSVGQDVGGWIELVRPKRLPDPYLMIVNEEGLLLRLPQNYIGSVMYDNYIAGDIVIMKEGMTDEGPEIIGLTDDDVKYLNELLNLHLEV